MARATDAIADNAHGELFVDSLCIHGGVARS
jgi:hypothetical protein